VTGIATRDNDKSAGMHWSPDTRQATSAAMLQAEGYVTYLLSFPIRYVTYPSAESAMEVVMMPVIRIDDATFAGLSTLKTWFGTKTPGETIERVVRDAMEQLGFERDDQPDSEVVVSKGGALEFTEAPGLTFTKPLAASLNGTAIQSPRWSTILFAMIAHLKGQGLSSEQLVRELHIPVKVGNYEREGFRYHHKLGISLQGQSATDAWKEVDRLAKKWGVPVEVEFWWRQNSKAQFPGRTGILRSGGA